MKKSLFLLAGLLAGSLFAKAQSVKNDKSAVIDTSLTLTNQLKAIKPDPTFLNFKQGLLNSNKAAEISLQNYAPITNNLKSNMPVAKLPASADRMPVLKLGDTDKMHYTMLIKRLAGTAAPKQVP